MKQVFKAIALTAGISLLISGCFNNGGEKSSANKEKISTEEVKTDNRGYIVKVGDELPQFEMRLTDGTVVNTKDFRGKVVMLQFTASWCSVCREEMPHIEKEIWQLHKENQDNFLLYGIDLKESPEKVAEFAASIPVTYPIGLDPDGEIFSLFCEKGAGVTRNIIIDRIGNIAMLTRLYDPAEFELMKATIKNELRKR